MIREAIASLAEGEVLDGEQAYETFKEIMSGETSESQIAAFITALRIRGESADVISGCARAMREKFVYVDPHADDAIDIVGTGGDGAQTFNISTASAIVAAARGITVAKHGNRNVSSKCGSADVLKALGVNIDIAPAKMEVCLERIGIAFLFAPTLHPAMKYAIGPRREIGIRTIFNILGPLCNPSKTRRGLMGVYSQELLPVMAEAAMQLGAEHLLVVHARDGLDEITTTDKTLVCEIKDGEMSSYEIDPIRFDIPRSKPADLRGGEPDENADIVRKIIAGEQGPRRAIVELNAGAAIYTAGRADSIAGGIELARAAIDSGASAQKLREWVDITDNS